MTPTEKELLDVLREIEPHLRLEHDPLISDCVLRSRSEQLRIAADEAARYERAVMLVREAIKKHSLPSK